MTQTVIGCNGHSWGLNRKSFIRDYVLWVTVSNVLKSLKCLQRTISLMIAKSIVLIWALGDMTVVSFE